MSFNRIPNRNPSGLEAPNAPEQLRPLSPFELIQPITKKYEEVGGQAYLGSPISEESRGRDSRGEYISRAYQRGAIFWRPGTAARVIRGKIFDKYKSLDSGTRSALGFLLTDETRMQGTGQGAYNHFENGTIYWKDNAAQAFLLDQNMWIKWIQLGGESFGFPTSDVVATRDGKGKVIRFSDNRSIYWHPHTGAKFVGGEILNRWMQIGAESTTTSLGYPTSDEKVINGGKISYFQRGAIYDHPSTGFRMLKGPVYKKYEDTGGPSGYLGFPTTDETNGSGLVTKYVGFQNGIIVLTHDGNAWDIKGLQVNAVRGRAWHGDLAGGGGDPDPYFNAFTKGNNPRFPSVGQWDDVPSGDWIDLSAAGSTHLTTIDPVRYNTTFWIDFEAHDDDGSSGDDPLGSTREAFHMGTLWNLGLEQTGLSGRTMPVGGSGREGRFEIEIFTQPLLYYDTSITAFRHMQWWSFDNFNRNQLSWEEFALAYPDTNSTRDGASYLDKKFYDSLFMSIGKEGNCFGMILEAIYARKGFTTFILPLNRYELYSFDEFSSIMPLDREISLRHTYQLGRSFVDWFFDMLESSDNEINDPNKTFEVIKRSLDSGEPITVSISKGLLTIPAHTLLAYNYKESSNEKIVYVADPNKPYNSSVSHEEDNEKSKIIIDPRSNDWSYTMASGNVWSSKTLGLPGPFYQMPTALFLSPPVNPIGFGYLMSDIARILFSSSSEESNNSNSNNNVLGSTQLPAGISQIADDQGHRFYMQNKEHRFVSDINIDPGTRMVNAFRFIPSDSGEIVTGGEVEAPFNGTNLGEIVTGGEVEAPFDVSNTPFDAFRGDNDAGPTLDLTPARLDKEMYFLKKANDRSYTIDILGMRACRYGLSFTCGGRTVDVVTQLSSESERDVLQVSRSGLAGHVVKFVPRARTKEIQITMTTVAPGLDGSRTISIEDLTVSRNEGLSVYWGYESAALIVKNEGSVPSRFIYKASKTSAQGGEEEGGRQLVNINPGGTVTIGPMNWNDLSTSIIGEDVTDGQGGGNIPT